MFVEPTAEQLAPTVKPVATDPQVVAAPPPQTAVYGAGPFAAPEVRITSYVTVPVVPNCGHTTGMLPDPFVSAMPAKNGAL
jgi:hypothetical protein